MGGADVSPTAWVFPTLEKNAQAGQLADSALLFLRGNQGQKLLVIIDPGSTAFVFPPLEQAMLYLS